MTKYTKEKGKANVTRRRLTLGALAAGCLAGSPSIRASTKVKVRLWMTGVGLDNFLKTVAVPEFEKENPGIELEVTSLTWTAYHQKILSAISANAGPDVVSFYSVDTAPWAARGVLAPLDGMVDPGLFLPSALANGRWGGKIYSLPIGLRMRPLYYRNDFLKAAGLNKPPASWDELRAYAKKLVKKDAAGNIERVGFWVPTNHPYKTVQVYIGFLWNAGGDILAADGKTATFNSPAGIEAAQFLADLLRVDKVDIPGAIKIENVDFAQGRVAMLVSNAATRGLIKNYPQLKGEVGVAMVPARKSHFIELSGDMIGVAANTKQPREAQKVINFIATRGDIATKYLSIDQMIPSLKSLTNSDYARNDPWIPTYLKMVDHARPLPAHPRWTEISTLLTKALDSIYLEGKPAKLALDQAASAANEILARKY